jgi:hypothetical protein
VISNPQSIPVWNDITARIAPHTLNCCQPMSIARWFVLRELVRNGEVSLPVFCSDWDILFFSPLKASTSPFLKHDFCLSTAYDLASPHSSAAYTVNAIAPLDAFCDLIEHICATGNQAVKVNDMIGWSQVAASGKFSVGDLFSITNGSVFDHNIACGRDRFYMDNPSAEIALRAKTIIWKDSSPYFVKLDQSLVKANTIHCWGTFKTKTSELCRLAGIA